MKVCLIYKGYFDESAAGPEIRYLSLARELCESGHQVTLGGRRASQENKERFHFVRVNALFELLRQVLSADVVVLHGGGPFLLLISVLAKLVGVGVILDGYALHWLELYEAAQRKPTIRLHVKILFNLARMVWAAAGGADRIVVANQRQRDLVRGILASFGRMGSMNRIVVIPNGCDNPPVADREQEGAAVRELSEIRSRGFVFGWIGGTWEWFAFSPVMEGLKLTNEYACKEAYLCFFGVDGEQRDRLSALATQHGVQDRVVFLPRVPYERRLGVWQHLDATVVWSAQTLESDYASRTRNFDSASLGLPVVQNEDGEWSGVLEKYGCGLVCKKNELGEAMARLVNEPHTYAQMQRNMKTFAQELSWSRVARQWLAVFDSLSEKSGIWSRIRSSAFAIVVVVVVLPLLAVSSLRQFE